MGSTTNPQPDTRCPNCQQEAGEAASSVDEDGVCIMECHNQNCAVGRFWGTDNEHKFHKPTTA